MIEIDGEYYPEITTDARTMRALTIADVAIKLLTGLCELIGKHPLIAESAIEIARTQFALATLSIPLYPKRLKLGGVVLPKNDGAMGMPQFVVRGDYDRD